MYKIWPILYRPKTKGGGLKMAKMGKRKFNPLQIPMMMLNRQEIGLKWNWGPQDGMD